MALAGFETLDFDDFHQHELPRRLAAGHAALAAPAVARRQSLAFQLPAGDAYTYIPIPDGVAIAPGAAEADTVIELDLESWEGLVHDYESAPGLLYGRRVRCGRGDAMDFVAWEPALRAMYTGRPVFDPYHVRLVDEDDRPLDPERAFTLEDDRDELARFLRAAGYLLVRGVFASDEVAAFLEEAHELRAEAVKGDKLSWWAKNAAGEEVLCRVTRAADKPRLATLKGEPRIGLLAELADVPLVPRDGEGNGVTVIYKNPDITEGLSDLPWHRDCGMGGHSLMCPVMIASVFLTPSSPDSGDLRFLPGSWRGTCGFMDPVRGNAPRGAGFEAEPGDVCIHYGDVMHAAAPPRGRGLGSYRISATTGFARPDARVHGGRQSYNEVLHGRADGQVEHLQKVAERS